MAQVNRFGYGRISSGFLKGGKILKIADFNSVIIGS
jgi:hypothetical protein